MPFQHPPPTRRGFGLSHWLPSVVAIGFSMASCTAVGPATRKDGTSASLVAEAMNWPGTQIEPSYGANLTRLMSVNRPPFTPDLLSEMEEVLEMYRLRQGNSPYPMAEGEFRSGLGFPWDRTGDLDLRSRKMGPLQTRSTQNGELLEFQEELRSAVNGEIAITVREWRITTKPSGHRMLIDNAEFVSRTTREGRKHRPGRYHWNLRRELSEFRKMLETIKVVPQSRAQST